MSKTNNMRIYILTSTLVLLFAIGCTSQPKNDKVVTITKKLAKFEPEDGKCLFFIGQDMPAIGGIEGYNDGYCDHFDIPAGITGYTNFSPGSECYGRIMTGNDGIFELANWGSGDSYLDFQLKQPGFENCAVAIGLAFVDHEKNVADGVHDNLIEDLGKWIKSLDKRPVFLRIGYEFDGHAWNHYDRENYLKTWHRIVDKMRAMGVNNVAYVWQSKGIGTTMEELMEWYPGDEYVDWCGYTYFAHPDDEMIKFARKRGKPVFIAELTPVFQEGLTDVYYDADIKKPEIAKKMWDEWYTTFFKTIEENEDVVKAFSYINTDWPSEAMWVDNPTFNQVDSRIQKSEYVGERWEKEVSKDRYLKPTPELFNILWGNNK